MNDSFLREKLRKEPMAGLDILASELGKRLDVSVDDIAKLLTGMGSPNGSSSEEIYYLCGLRNALLEVCNGKRAKDVQKYIDSLPDEA